MLHHKTSHVDHTCEHDIANKVYILKEKIVSNVLMLYVEKSHTWYVDNLLILAC